MTPRAGLVTLALTATSCTRAPSAPPQPPIARAPEAPDATATAVPPSRPDPRRCLPLVSGCGCATVCALTMRVLPDGAHEVTHDHQDSRLDRATIERWCFDDTGRGSPAIVANASQRRCISVFYDGSSCGGECIPSLDALRCTRVGARCAPGP